MATRLGVAAMYRVIYHDAIILTPLLCCTPSQGEGIANNSYSQTTGIRAQTSLAILVFILVVILVVILVIAANKSFYQNKTPFRGLLNQTAICVPGARSGSRGISGNDSTLSPPVENEQDRVIYHDYMYLWNYQAMISPTHPPVPYSRNNWYLARGQSSRLMPYFQVP